MHSVMPRRGIILITEKFQHFCGKKFLGIDYGTKTIGLSLYHVGRYPFALPSESISRQSDGKAVEMIAKIIEEEEIDHIVLGLPLYLNGENSSMTFRVKRFGRFLSVKLQREIFYQDESLSSIEAENLMKRSPKYNFKVDSKKVDSLAASMILEDFFHP